MIVQAVCLPEGSKILVIPIFFPIIPFMFVSLCLKVIGTFFAVSVDGLPPDLSKSQSPFAADLFLYGEVPAVNKP
jgi:hypothetical protein